jgi:hypothetical protein
MSNFVWGGKTHYPDYLKAKLYMDMTDFNEDLSGDRYTQEMSHATRQIIASNEALTEENIRLHDKGLTTLSDGIDLKMDLISYEIKKTKTEIDSKFNWSMCHLLAQTGRMNDSLTELIKISKTPVQTAAYEQFEIARDAYRRGLYLECLEALNKAINGDHTTVGYKLEWRFHQMKGTLHLGFTDCDYTFIDLAKAEESFLLAGRYAKTDFHEYAGQAYLSAGWAAYCQGNLTEALAHTELAISTIDIALDKLTPVLRLRKLSNEKNSGLIELFLSKKNTLQGVLFSAEAHFQAAKIRMALNDVENALLSLGASIDIDALYSLKAAGDGDFQKHDEQLQKFLAKYRNNYFRDTIEQFKYTVNSYKIIIENAPEANNFKPLQLVQSYIAGINNDLSFLDMKQRAIDLSKMINEIELLPITIMVKGADLICTIEEPFQVDEEYEAEEIYPFKQTYTEDVIVKPGWLFRKPVTEKVTKTRTINKKKLVTKTRTITKTRKVNQTIPGTEICFEFCYVGRPGFCLGKYPVTQSQWLAIMGENPSEFKGPDLPVESVSFEMVQKFIEKLNSSSEAIRYRLPDSFEWWSYAEYGINYNGAQCNDLSKYGWFFCNSDNSTHPVGQKIPTRHGLYDMVGNVSEWSQDGRIKGGNWNSLSCPYNEDLLACNDDKLKLAASNTKGFRLVAELTDN